MISHLRRVWEPGQHLSVIAPTGGGKSYLVARGLLPLWSHTMILDVKGDDQTLLDSGHLATRGYPSKMETVWQEATRFRVHPGGFSRTHRPRWDAVFRGVWASGKGRRSATWTVYADETRLLADNKYLGLGPHLDAIWISGRSRGITLIAGTQAPRFVPSSFYDQARYHVIGYVRDRRALRRLEEIGGETDMIQEVVPSLDFERHEFLFLGPGWAARAFVPRLPKPPRPDKRPALRTTF